MHGLDYSEDCTKLYVLCRGSQKATFNLDLVPGALALFPFSKNFIDTASVEKDFMYIYQITNAVLSSPEIWTISKAIRGWEYGNNLLKVHKPASQFLSFVLKTGMCVIGQPSNCHEGSTFMKIDVVAKKIVSGDPWGCANGHTIVQRLAFNRLSQKSIEVCGTDGGYPGLNHTFGVWSHRLEGGATPIGAIDYASSINPSGGPGGMAAYGRGFVATIVSSNPLQKVDSSWASSIGLVFMNENGTVVGTTKWLSVNPNYFVNYANVAPLSNGNLLVGWAELAPKNGSGAASANDIPIGQVFRLAEFNSNGLMLTNPIATEHGWSSVDNWDTINGNPFWVWAKGTADEYSYTSSSSTLKIMTYVPVLASATETGSVDEVPQQEPSTAPGAAEATPTLSESTGGMAGYLIALVVLASVALVAIVLILVLVVLRSSNAEVV